MSQEGEGGEAGEAGEGAEGLTSSDDVSVTNDSTTSVWTSSNNSHDQVYHMSNGGQTTSSSDPQQQPSTTATPSSPPPPSLPSPPPTPTAPLASEHNNKNNSNCDNNQLLLFTHQLISGSDQRLYSSGDNGESASGAGSASTSTGTCPNNSNQPHELTAPPPPPPLNTSSFNDSRTDIGFSGAAEPPNDSSIPMDSAASRPLTATTDPQPPPQPPPPTYISPSYGSSNSSNNNNNNNNNNNHEHLVQQKTGSAAGDHLIDEEAGQLNGNGNGDSTPQAPELSNGSSSSSSGGGGGGDGGGGGGGRGNEGSSSKSGILRIGYRFEQFDHHEDTWAGIWREVKDALARRGHTAVNIRSVHKLDANDNKSRWKRQQLVCKCYGLGRPKRPNDSEKKRRSHSNKTNCPFKVTVSWPKTGSPNITQLELTHNEECNADKRKAARDELVPIEVLHNECYEDVKQWNIAGLRKSDMFRLLQDRFAPLKLGEDGRRKVRNMCIKADRELAAIVEDFSSNWEAGEASEALHRAELGASGGGAPAHSRCNDSPENDDVLLCPLREKLLANLKGIAAREASRLVANLSIRLTPEMAMAVYQNLTLQVDALISGSGVVAGPMRAPAGALIPGVAPPPAFSRMSTPLEMSRVQSPGVPLSHTPLSLPPLASHVRTPPVAGLAPHGTLSNVAPQMSAVSLSKGVKVSQVPCLAAGQVPPGLEEGRGAEWDDDARESAAKRARVGSELL